MRGLAAVVAGVLAGLGAGAIWTWAQPDRFRADARVVVRPSSSRVVPAVEALAESSLVAANVAQTLHLAAPPHIAATVSDGGLVRISVEGPSRDRARQVDAEAVVILTQKVPQRFPGVRATVLDPAHSEEQTSPTPARNLLITGLAGLIAGIGIAAALVRTRSPHAEAVTRTVDAAGEGRLNARIEEVARRERALARRAGELAGREHGVERSAGELAARKAALERRAGELAARAEELEAREAETREREEPPPAPAAPVAPLEPPPPEPVAVRTSRWTLGELEQHVRERRADFPERAEEWDTYLFLLRGHANVDGSLAASFDSLIADVFGPLPHRAA